MSSLHYICTYTLAGEYMIKPNQCTKNINSFRNWICIAFIYNIINGHCGNSMYRHLFISKEKILDIKRVAFGDSGSVLGIIITLKHVESSCNHELINRCIKRTVNNHYLRTAVAIISFIPGLFCRKNDLLLILFLETEQPEVCLFSV